MVEQGVGHITVALMGPGGCPPAMLSYLLTAISLHDMIKTSCPAVIAEHRATLSSAMGCTSCQRGSRYSTITACVQFLRSNELRRPHDRQLHGIPTAYALLLCLQGAGSGREVVIDTSLPRIYAIKSTLEIKTTIQHRLLPISQG